jgi:(p)ppGpp synthase/HD superfamily hydrolase
MRMDAESLVAGLLHDTVEDTDAVCFDDIERRFGAAVRRIVEGETKISKITKVNASGGGRRWGRLLV